MSSRVLSLHLWPSRNFQGHEVFWQADFGTVSTQLTEQVHSDEEVVGEVSRLREEVEILRGELHRAEVELEDRCWMAPTVLQVLAGSSNHSLLAKYHSAVPLLIMM